MNLASKKHFLNKWPRWIGILSILIGICGCNSVAPFKSTANRIQDASESLASQLAVNLATDQKLRVGILPFRSGTNSVAIRLAQALQESLKNRLFLTKRFDVVEDDDMRKVLRELKIQEQGEGILRSDTIHHMGRLLGADAILVGTINDVDNSDYMINCRLIPIKSGVVESVGEAKIRIIDTKLPVAPRLIFGPANQPQPAYHGYYYQYRGDTSSQGENPYSKPYYYQHRPASQSGH